MKKCLALASILVLSLSNLALADFTDVDSKHPYADAILWLQDNEVVEGYSDGSYGINRLVNRAEFLKMLYETVRYDEDFDLVHLNSQSFPGVPDDAWYANYVKQAVADNIVDGYPDGSFGPDKNINFAEAVKIVSNAFFDVDDLYSSEGYQQCLLDFSYTEGNWYAKYFKVADDLCVIPEQANINGFSPNDLVTRGDMAEMLYRAKAVKDKGYVTNAISGEIDVEEYDGKMVPDAILREVTVVIDEEGNQVIVEDAESVEGGGSGSGSGSSGSESGSGSTVVQVPAWCVGGPEQTSGIGAEFYAVDPKYSHLTYLAQIFSADDCGADRLREMWGVVGNNYTLGSTFSISFVPSPDLANEFWDIGFRCADEGVSISVCQNWTLSEIVPLTEILKLKPYALELDSDDCVNCG